MVEAISSEITIPHDGCVQSFTHVLEITLERSLRYFQLVNESLYRDRAALVEQLVDSIEAFGAIHGSV